MENAMIIKDQLRSARTQAGMTQERVAHAAGMHPTQYNGYETGRSTPGAKTLGRIATAIGLPIEELVPCADVPNVHAARDKQAEFDWENTLEMLRGLTAERLGIKSDRVSVTVQVA